ncbi:hypothetical protein Cantr_01223 [Candida viswanathii]|uniref:Uncharacterized protein n=1 Tax=Candida viswanathii TaxID=5486 RepID=A0A367YJZ3_9ASCO|nr:hypothetical protein Cantr_01223 [Candida viswanathii]
MWTIRPFVQIDLDLTLPPTLIDLLGFGAEIFEGYLVSLKNQGIIDEESVPPPKTVCVHPSTVVNQPIPYCILVFCIFLNIIHSSSSSDESSGLSSHILLEYKGIPLPTTSDFPSPKLANKVLTKNFQAKNKSLMYSKKFPFGILQRIVELCDEALLINPPSNNDDNVLAFSPGSEKALNSVMNRNVLETSDLAIRQIIEDTQQLVTDKLDTCHGWFLYCNTWRRSSTRWICWF